MKKIVSFGLSAFVTVTLSVHAQTNVSKEEVDAAVKNAKSYTSVSPVFGEIVTFSTPSDFKPAFENTNGPNYIREAVLKGETVNNWTQMITLTGRKGLASNANVTPQIVVESIANGYKRACPNSFSAKPISQAKIGGNIAFTAVVSCGTSPTSSGHTSESMIIAAVKGKENYYTFQLAVQGAASAKPLEIDSAVWIARFNSLLPITLIPIAPGEARSDSTDVNRK